MATSSLHDRIDRLGPEERFVVAATRPPPGKVGRSLPWKVPAQDALNPGLLVTVADRNKVLPRVWRFAAECDSPASRGEGEWRRARVRADQLSQQAVRRHLEGLRIVRLMSGAGIEALPLKGTFLSERLYGDPTLRQSSDLDLLVRPEALEGALALLEEQGYQVVRPEVRPRGRAIRWVVEEYSDYSMILKGPGPVQVELHWRLTYDGRFPGELSGALWDRLDLREISGVRIPCMAPRDLLLYLAVHGTKDQWRRLSWLADFAWLVASAPEGVVESAAAESAEHGLAVTWAVSCSLAEAWYGISTGTEPSSSMHRRRARYLADHTSLMLPDPLAVPGGGDRYDWHSRDSILSSVRSLVGRYVRVSYAWPRSPAEYRPGLQRLRRLRRGLGRILKIFGAGSGPEAR